MKQYLENTTGKTSKFWEIELDGQHHVLRYGKVGSDGKNSRKDLKTPEKALVAFKRLVAKKTGSGYFDPQSKVAELECEQTVFNDKTFEHAGEVESVYYFKPQKLLISSTTTTFFLWTTNGELLDTYVFGEREYFWGEISFKEIPNSQQVLCYVKDTYKLNHLLLMDLSNQKIELVREEKIDLPVKGYSGDLDLNEEHIYLGYSNGFMLLDYAFNILKTIKTPQQEENSSGVAVNAKQGLIAFVQYVDSGQEPVVIVDLDGNVVSEFKSRAHGGSGMNLCFNAAGTRLYLASSSNYETKVEVWSSRKGELEKSLINYSSSGHVLSFGLHSDEKYLAIRVAGIDLILWNIEEESVEWVKVNQALNCQFAFGEEGTLYQSLGNRLTPVNMEDGESMLALKALSELCNQMHYDDRQKQLWLSGGKRILCFDEAGVLLRTLDATTFLVGELTDRILLVKRGRAYAHNDYLWFDVVTGQETSLMCEVLKTVAFNDEFILSTSGYFSQKKKATRLWSLSGKLLKEFKPKKDYSMSLLGKKQMVLYDGKKLELWTIGADKPIFINKKAHSKGIDQVVVYHNQAHFISVGGSEFHFWKGASDEAQCFEVLAGQIKVVLSKASLSVYVLITENGFIYSFDPETQELKLLIRAAVEINQACFSSTGMLYISTKKMEVLQLNLANYISVEVVETTPVKEMNLDFSPLEKSTSPETLQAFIENLDLKSLQEADFLTLRNYLDTYEQEHGIVEAHQVFTKKMMQDGAVLKHQFAHEEELSSYAMSPDGKYLALGTWVGENYQEDGTLQIWELKTGRCINLLKENYGGVGWPDYPDNIQWSPDSEGLAAAINTNSVSKFNPFSAATAAMTNACVTNGWSRPPAWCWLGNTGNIVVSAWHNKSEIPACICKGTQANTYEDDAKWFAKKIKPMFKEMLNKEDLQPYVWCRTTLDGKYIYGFNGHNQSYCIDIERKQLAWLKISSKPVGFGAEYDFFVYNEGAQLVLADLKTGAPKEYIRASFDAKYFEFAGDGQRFAVYTRRKIRVYDYKTEIATIDLEISLSGQRFSDSELRSLRFNTENNAIACLLDNGTLQIYDLEKKKFTLKQAYVSNGVGIYWGDNLVAVSSDFVDFIHISEDLTTATSVHQYDKYAQVEAYNALYGEVPSPLKLKKQDLTTYFEHQPLFPLSVDGNAEWVVAIDKDVVISSCTDVKRLDQYLSYTWKEKYAWPFAWGGASLYPSMEVAAQDPKLPFTEKERALFVSKKKGNVKKGIEFKKGGSILDIIKVHEQSNKELEGNWDSHVSEHNEIICKRLIQLEKYEMALKIANQTPSWSIKIANLGFVACQLFHKGKEEMAIEAYEKALLALDKASEKDKDWMATFVYAPIAAAAQLLGKKQAAADYFKKAYHRIEDNSNPFQKEFQLALSYLYCKEEAKAMEVMKKGEWTYHFAQFQIKFVHELMDLGHFDLAMEYIDLGIEKYDKIDNFDLLYRGFNYLIKEEKYRASIEWMEKFPGLSVDECQEKLINTLVEKEEKEFATTYILGKLKGMTWANGIAKYARYLSYVNPSAAKEILDNLPTGEKPYYPTAYYKDLGRAQSNVGDLTTAKATLSNIPDASNQFHYLIGLLDKKNPEAALQQSFLDQAVLLLDQLGLEDTEMVEHCLKVGAAAKKIGDEGTEAAMHEKANASSKGNSSLLKSTSSEAEKLQEAYGVFKKQTPRDRIYGMRDFAFKVAQKGFWKNAAELLKTVPAKDLNDRHGAIMKIIEEL